MIQHEVVKYAWCKAHLSRREVRIPPCDRLMGTSSRLNWSQRMTHFGPWCLDASVSGSSDGLPYRKVRMRTLNKNSCILHRLYIYMGVSENSVPLNPMVLLIIIPFLNG